MMRHSIYKHHDIQHVRLKRWETIPKGGWHFSYFGTTKFIVNKLTQFSHQETNNDYFKNEKRIDDVIKNKKDLFDREDRLYKYLPIEENTFLPKNYKMLTDFEYYI